MKFFPLIWAGLMRRKLRTVLTVLSIFVAFLLYGLLGAVRTALDGGVSMAGADRLVVRHKVSIIQTLPQSYLARLQQIPGVTLVSGQTWFGGIYQDPKNFFPTVPVDPDPFLKMYPEFVVPPDQVEAWKKTRNGAIVGITTANRFGWKIGDTVRYSHRSGAVRTGAMSGNLRSWASTPARRKTRIQASFSSAMTTSRSRANETKVRWAGIWSGWTIRTAPMPLPR